MIALTSLTRENEDVHDTKLDWENESYIVTHSIIVDGGRSVNTISHGLYQKRELTNFHPVTFIIKVVDENLVKHLGTISYILIKIDMLSFLSHFWLWSCRTVEEHLLKH